MEHSETLDPRPQGPDQGGQRQGGRRGFLLFLTVMLQDSFFYRIAVKLANGIYTAVDNSALSRWISSYPTLSTKESLICTLLFRRPAEGFKKFRLWFASLVEESFFNRLWWQLSRALLALDMVSWGTGLLAFGVVLLLVQMVQLVTKAAATPLTIQTGFAVACIFSSLLCASSREPLGETVLDSRIFSRILIDFCGVRKSSLSVERARHGYLLPIFLGALLGLLTFRIPLLVLLFLVVAVIGAAIVLCVPETGLMVVLLALPFVGTMPLTLLCLYVDLAYLFKLMRCKRVMVIEAIDIAVAGFGLALLFLGGLTSIRRGSSLQQVALYLVYILTYLMAANSIRGKKLADRVADCMLLSALGASLMGIYQNIVGLESSVSWLDQEMFAEIGSRVVGPFDNPNVFGEYLIMVLPLALCCMALGGGIRRALGLVVTGTVGVALIFTWSRGAWLGAMLAVGLFLLLLQPKLLRLALPGLLALPFLPAVVPASILNRLTSIGNLADTSTAYRVSIWTASVKMIKEIFVTGIGTGSQAFTALYPVYALGGAAYALHAHNLYLQIFIELGLLGMLTFVIMLVLFYKWVFYNYRTITNRRYASIILALGMGILGLLVQGLTDNVWFNYRIVLFFWILMGLAVGIGRSTTIDKSESRRERIHENS